VIIEVVIHAKAALAIPHIRCRKRAHKPEVVLAEHTDNIVKLVPVLQPRGMFVAVVIFFDFFINGQDHRHLVNVLIDVLLY